MSFSSLGWNPPFRPNAVVDQYAYVRAIASARDVSSLPRRPAIPQTRRARRSVESGPEVQLFLATMEVARLLKITAPSNTIAAGAKISVEISGNTMTLVRPSDADLPTWAAITKLRAPEQHSRLEELIAQDEAVDRFMLDALDMSSLDFPATHTWARTALVSANVVSLKLKDMFQVARPHDKIGGSTINPVLPIPPHSSFPGGHATHTAALAVVLSDLLGVALDRTAALGEQNGLQALAWRIADNREIAGLHYAQDTVAGFELGDWFGSALMAAANTGGPSALNTLWRAAIVECT